MNDQPNEKVQRLRALMAKATCAPWQIDGACCGVHDTETRAIYHVNESRGHRHVHEVVEGGCECQDNPIGIADAELIVAMRNELPELLDLIESLRAQYEAEKVAHAETRERCEEAEAKTARRLLTVDEVRRAQMEGLTIQWSPDQWLEIPVMSTRTLEYNLARYRFRAVEHQEAE